ncbi:hypothetical protein FSP39_009514 [Pinctada imbricata]|uniref:Roc domain-containing protein n=1 Tax=Pinctada imbricata TaxID=66713 RepID=A0AA88YCK5_PINIB|nr:hypothetical protein FSP39_009514 [Pinctada imbricata]
MLKKARFERNSEGRNASNSKSPKGSPSRSRSNSKSPKRRGSSQSKAMSNSSSPNRNAPGSGKTRSSSGRKGSKSPSPNRRTKSPSSSKPDSGDSRGRSAKKTKGPVRIRSPDRTENGLKVRDFSDQGLTVMPQTLLQEKDLGIVNLSGNNLKGLPPEIQRWDTLEKLDLSKNYGLRRTKANDSSLPREILLLPNLRELVLSECNMQRLPPILWQMTNLQVLDISRNKINVLVPEVGNLSNLRKINLKHTNITTLPPEIVYCQELEEILLWGNKIETLPETLPELLKLKTLALNYRDFCKLADQYMESFINKGQIKSEHIPRIVFMLPALQSMDLECTKINNLPETTNLGLQELNLSRNFLQVLPDSVYTLNHLTLLNLSDNQFSNLPNEVGNLKTLVKLRVAKNQLTQLPITIGKLKNLKELDASDNKLKRLPTQIRGLKSLKVMHLENNELVGLPDEICELTDIETLNVSDNNIHTLPMKLHQLVHLKDAHVYDRYYKKGLWLFKNPLTQPPKEIWRADKTDAIFKYLKELAIIKTQNLQRQKMLMIGESGCGKTSLVQALLHGKSLSEEEDGAHIKTSYVEQSIWKTKNLVEYLINDFGGDDTYNLGYSLFLDAKALVTLVYDHSKYKTENHQDSVGCWLDMLNKYAPGVVVKLIGTKTDLIEDEAIVDIKAELVMSEIERQQQTYGLRLQQELRRIQKDIKEAEASHATELLQHLTANKAKIEKLLSKPLRIMPDISMVSSKEGLMGLPDLVNSLELLAINKDLFPHGQRAVPELWCKFRYKLKRQPGFYLQWSKVESLAEKMNLIYGDMQACMRYLGDIGELLWFQGIPGLSHIIFHKPRHLISIVTSLYRHNVKEYLDFEQNKIFMSFGKFTTETFQMATEIFYNFGQVSRPLLACFWSEHMLNNDQFTELLELTPNLGICYTIPEPEVPMGTNVALPLMVLPWYNKEAADNSVVETFVGEVPEGGTILQIHYVFPFGMPKSIFHKLSTAVQENILSRIDWSNALFATIEEASFLIIYYSKQEHNDHGNLEQGEMPQNAGQGDLIRIMFKGENEAAAEEAIRKVTQSVASVLERVNGLVWKIEAPGKLWKNRVIRLEEERADLGKRENSF